MPLARRLSEGSESASAQSHQVPSGSVWVEPEGLRHWVVGGREVVSRLHLQVRDRLWHALPLTVTDSEVVRTDDGLTLVTRGRVVAAGLHIEIRLQVAIGAAVTADLEVRAVERSVYNRIGWCLLLPAAGLGGSEFVAVRDGTEVARTTLAGDVLPQPQVAGRPASFLPPFDEVFVELASGQTLQVWFAGDLFEIEDQRNWSDDSFKLYSTPLGLGLPRSAEAGTTITQQIRVALRKTTPRPRAVAVLRSELFAFAGPLPSIGSVSDDPGADAQRAGLTHLLLRTGAEPTQFTGAVAGALGCRPTPGEILVTRDGWVELNRVRPRLSPGVGVLIPLNATVHAADDESIRSTVHTHRTIAQQARALFPGRSVHLGPFDFDSEPGPWSPGPLPSAGSPDPRRRASFAAAWVVASIAEVLSACPASLTYLDLDVLYADGYATPVGRVLQWLANRVGQDTYLPVRGLPTDTSALAWHGSGAWDVLLANNSAAAVLVAVRDADGEQIRLPPGEVALIERWTP